MDGAQKPRYRYLKKEFVSRLNQQAFTKTLFETLQQYPEGLSEFSLLTQLEEKGVPSFEKKRGDSLNLFRCHFFLFHHLYILKEALFSQKQGDLKIHWSKILFLPWKPPGSSSPAKFDHLKEYYLNLENMYAMDRNGVDVMLQNFWVEFSRYDKRSEACAALGLSETASSHELKSQYKKLVFEHHPDRGGNRKQFDTIRNAGEILFKKQI